MISALLATVLVAASAEVPASLEGHVEVTRRLPFIKSVDERGAPPARPIADAVVAFEGADGIVRQARTDASGRFSLPGLRETVAADARFSVDHAGYSGMLVPVSLLNAEHGFVQIGLVRVSQSCERRVPLVSVSRR